MATALRGLLGRARERFAADLRSDPYLRYLLVVALLLAGFWFWHRIPNFATRDEYSRLLDVMVPLGKVTADPGLASLREGVVWSRVPFGATFYLFGLAVLPVYLVALATGQADVFAAMADPVREFGHYPIWHSTPEWVWTWSLVFVRLFNVLFAVGCVYLTYRLGVATRDRSTGRLAALLLTLTFGFLTIAHEGGEDMPMLFFFLLALYLLVRYVQSGAERSFLAASAVGGVAIAFKLTAAPVVALVGIAHLLRTRATSGTRREWANAFFRWRLLSLGAVLGAVAIVLGFPTALVGAPVEFAQRIFGGPVARATHETGPDAPVWWWFLRGYFSALGLPLFVAAAGGVAATVASLRADLVKRRDTALVATGLALYLLLFSGWHDFRVHHLLPTFPLIMVLLAGALVRLRGRRPQVARVVIAALLVSSGTYAVAGDLGYASMPRDQATAWLNEHAAENATVEVYRVHFQDTAVPHDMRVNHLGGPEEPGERVDPCPEYIQLGYRDLLYLDEDSYYRDSQVRAEYFRSLLEGEYNYTIAAEFGSRPPNFVPQRPTPGSFVDLLHLGIVPQTDQYADEQELAENQYTVILKRTGACDPSRVPPF